MRAPGYWGRLAAGSLLVGVGCACFGFTTLQTIGVISLMSALITWSKDR